MKKINEKVMAVVSRLCVAVLALLGFSCSDSNGVGSECMYGTPTGSFDAKGTVTDEEGSPVENAEVRVTFPNAPSGIYSVETVKTNSSGEYAMMGGSDGATQMKVVCVPQGDLEPDSVIVELDYDKKGSTWNKGNASFTADFKLNKKQ